MEQYNVSDLKEGKHVAFETLFKTWYAPLCNYANGIIRDSGDAEDVVQKVFCKIWDSRTTIEIHTSVKSYLYRMVHNDCINRIKQARVRAEHDVYYMNSSSTSTDDAESGVLCSELEQQILALIDTLPPKCKEVFRMSRMQHLSYTEISEKLDISVNTVENHIVKALRLLRDQLRDYLPVYMLLFFIFKSK